MYYFCINEIDRLITFYHPLFSSNQRQVCYPFYIAYYLNGVNNILNYFQVTLTSLWRVTGAGLIVPSHLSGRMHCGYLITLVTVVWTVQPCSLMVRWWTWFVIHRSVICVRFHQEVRIVYSSFHHISLLTFDLLISKTWDGRVVWSNVCCVLYMQYTCDKSWMLVDKQRGSAFSTYPVSSESSITCWILISPNSFQMYLCSI